MWNVFRYLNPVTLYGVTATRFKTMPFIHHAFFRYVVCAAFALCMALAALTLAPATAQAQGVPEIDEDTFIILAFGDSLMAGHGMDKELAFPAQLEKALRDAGYNVRVFNGARSGDTTFSGSRRLAWSLEKTDPDMVILGLGANDALRGMKPKQTRTNLAQMIYDIRSKEKLVLLTGMMAPPNMGPGYAAQFNGIYTQLSNYYSVPLYPFLLNGVAGKAHLNNEDGVHPNPDGVAVMVKGIMPYVERMLPDYIYVDPSLPPKDPAAYGGLE